MVVRPRSRRINDGLGKRRWRWIGRKSGRRLSGQGDAERKVRGEAAIAGIASTDKTTRRFYADIAPFTDFAAITEPRHYRPLPADWLIGLADVVDSTQAIARGRYKAVNMVGAAVLAAVTNALPEIAFPFTFGGDGASLAVPGGEVRIAKKALATTAAWAEDVLGLTLRIGLVPVAAIREVGLDVRVARFAASSAVSYAMFAGGGLAWAEARLKEGRIAIPRAALAERPDLAGLYCGFAPILRLRADHGQARCDPVADHSSCRR